MKKNKVLLYSDGSLFGGSEYVVINILNDNVLNAKYDFQFAYRKHKTYQRQVEKLIKSNKRILYPLHISSIDNIVLLINKYIRSKILQIICKIPLVIVERLQIINVYNAILFYFFLKKVKPDLIHINNGGFPAAESCLVLSWVAHKMGYKVIMQINNIPTDLKKYWDIYIKESVDSFIIASKFTSQKISSIRNITRDNIYTLKDCVKYVAPTISPDELKKKYNIADNAVVLIQVALLLSYKGQLNLLEALIRLREENPHFYKRVILILIGSGDMEQILRDFIIENNLSEKVLLLGYRNDYIDYVNMSDIMVHPTRANEDMPLIILSAMSLGKPVVSCRIAGIPEEIEDMRTGILLDPDSPNFNEELCTAIQLAYEKRVEFGNEAKSKFNREFSEEVYVKGLSEIYAKYLNE